MARVYFVHWNEEEATERTADLIAAGHEVRLHWSSDHAGKWGEYVPDAVIISLDRLPSHGRAIAEWVWEAKKRQSIPIIFAGGAEDKIAATKAKYPRAVFCSSAKVITTLHRLLGNA